MKYDILKAGDIDELKDMVRESSEMGWILCGGVTVDGGVFYQSVRHGSDGAGDAYKKGSFLQNMSEPCPICGNVGCTSKLHRDLVEIATLKDALKKVG